MCNRQTVCMIRLLGLTVLSIVLGAIGYADSSPYIVRWLTPSMNAYETMPLGNGEVALNARIDDMGNLRFYIARTDSIDENGRLLKLGALRIQTGNTGRKRTSDHFFQKLDVKRGVLEAELGKESERISYRLWVDACRPVVIVEIISTESSVATVHAELWRTKQEIIPLAESGDLHSPDYRGKGGQKTIVEPDTILKDLHDQIGWLHHNIHSTLYQRVAALQGTDDFPRQDPILKRTFGVLVRCSNPNRIDDLTMESQVSRVHRFEIAVMTKHPSTPDEWLAGASRILDEAQKESVASRLEKHEQWWQDFWNRSWIHITPSQQENADYQKNEDSDGFVLTRAYTLQRYITACAGRGNFPVKFNGSLFTVPEKGKPGDADYRRWGAAYWFQNTRLIYYPLFTSGDFDLILPFYRMYYEMLPVCKHRTMKHLGHEGAYYPEIVFPWGDIAPRAYGWDPPWNEREDKLQQNRWHKWEWVGGLEIAYMMLEYYQYTRDHVFLKEKAISFSHEILLFFDRHYSCDENGTLVMYPSQSLETWWECTNPMPEIAGLHAVCDRLLALPAGTVSDEKKRFWSAMKKKIPTLPTTVSKSGTTMLAPAERYEQKKNVENPELYAVYPFRLISYDKPNAEWGIEALQHRLDRGDYGWRQDDLFMAYLGLTDQAREYLVTRAKNKHLASRFPVFWGPNYDWIPDQDHGGILMRGVQSLIMQCDGQKIDLFPAWPMDWNCDFKLHAPCRTIIEGRLKERKLVELKVTPEFRRKDVRILLDK